MKEEAFLEKKTNLEITIEALREVEQLKNAPNKKSYSSFAELLKINIIPLFSLFSPASRDFPKFLPKK